MIPAIHNVIRAALAAAGGLLPAAYAQELEVVTVLALDLRDALRHEPGVSMTRDPPIRPTSWTATTIVRCSRARSTGAPASRCA